MSKREFPPAVQAALAELRQALSALYGVRLRGVYLYGSYARGDFHLESDVDVLVVLEGPIKPGAEISRINLAIAGICLRYSLLISILPVAVETFQNGPQVFFGPVRQEAIPI